MTKITQIDAVKFQEALDAMCVDKDKQITELQAHINLLREAFEEIDMQLKNGFVRCKTCGDQENTKDFDCRIWIADALASTPAQSLQVHDNEVIERCAETAYDWVMAYVVEDTAPVSCYEAIRALKAKI